MTDNTTTTIEGGAMVTRRDPDASDAPRWMVKAYRQAGEEAAAIVLGEDAQDAKDNFREMESVGKIDWHPGGEPSTMDYDIYEVEQVSDEEPLGCERDELTDLQRAGPLLLAAANMLLDYEKPSGWNSRQLRFLAAAAHVARQGNGGWELMDFDAGGEGAGLKHIERDDDVEIFDSDEEAVEFVRLCALQGDTRASEALRIHEENWPEIERRRNGEQDDE